MHVLHLVLKILGLLPVFVVMANAQVSYSTYYSTNSAPIPESETIEEEDSEKRPSALARQSVLRENTAGSYTNAGDSIEGITRGHDNLIQTNGTELTGENGNGWVYLPVNVQGDFTIELEAFGFSGDADGHLMLVRPGTSGGWGFRFCPQGTDTPELGLYSGSNFKSYTGFYFPSFVVKQAATSFPNNTWTKVSLSRDAGLLTMQVGGQKLTYETGDSEGEFQVGLGYYSKIKFKNIKVNASAALDLEMDELPEESEPAPNEEDPGAVIPWNVDDDNENGRPDNDRRERQGVENEDDLVVARIKIDEDKLYGASVTLSTREGGSKIRIWEDAYKTKEIVLPKTWVTDRAALPMEVYVEGVDVSNNEADVSLVLSYEKNGEKGSDQVKITVLGRAALLPDYDRDHVIGETDRDLSKEVDAEEKRKPFRFWVNDDDDEGEIARGETISTVFRADDDIPSGAHRGDADSRKVEGMRDLVDFFPVWVDIKDVLDRLPEADEYEFQLTGGGGNLYVVLTDLSPEQAGHYLTDVPTARSLASAPARRINGQNGLRLDAAFLDKIQNQNKGVILIKAAAATQEPLYLEIIHQNQKMARVPLPIGIGTVEQMYRTVNLTAGVTGNWNVEPKNYPDAETNGQNFVFVHGYNVNAEDARGWHAEMFKRLYWSGLKSKFYGVTWEGAEKTSLSRTPPDYHRAVRNAFAVAPVAAGVLRQLGPNTTVAAHSLGNMVVSSALQDYGVPVRSVLMLNAAVAMEAYGYGGEGMNSRNMVHPDWLSYDRKLWCSEWNQFFGFGDSRATLTWRNRFGGVGANVFNFYSQTEDVLQEHVGIPHISPSYDVNEAKRSTWALQEKMKGRYESRLSVAGIGSFYGGWKFNSYWDVVVPSPGPRQPRTQRHMTPLEATALTPVQLRQHPFFDEGRQNAPVWIRNLYQEQTGSVTVQQNREQLLAEMFPALTLPVGANSTAIFENYGRRNIQIDGVFKTDANAWRQMRRRNDWFHSDIKQVAYVHLYQAFDEIARLSGSGP